jgi:hypothetical protein
MAQTTIHQGSFDAIPPTATPGLLWLKDYIAIVDSLDGDAGRIASFTTSEARFVFNGNVGGTTSQVAAMLGKRSEKLRAFRHEGAVAWDIAKEDGTRTVLFESTSVTEFKEDNEGTGARVAEFGVVELVKEASGGDAPGCWKASELKMFMDPSPIVNRRKEP